MNETNTNKTKMILLSSGIVVALVVALGFAFWSRIFPNTAQNKAEACIANKATAVDKLLGTGSESATETASYKKEVEARGNQVFFDEYPDGVSETPAINYLNVGEDLPDGSRLLHARYSYHLDSCSADLKAEATSLSSDENKYQFTYTNSAGAQAQYIDETQTCQTAAPASQLADINGDGQDEIIVSCNGGGSSNQISLSAYKFNSIGLDSIGVLNSEGKYEVKDCNADGVQDVVTYIHDNRDLSSFSQPLVYCNYWDKQKNKFDIAN